MEQAFFAALQSDQGPSFIEVLVDKGEISTGLQTFGTAPNREKKDVSPLNEEDAPRSHQARCAFCRATIWR